DPYRAGFRRGSLAEALEVLSAGGEISRAFLETPDAAPGQLEGIPSPPRFRRHQLQPAPHDLRFSLPGRRFQLFEGGPFFFAKTRVNVGLHAATVAHNGRCV